MKNLIFILMLAGLATSCNRGSGLDGKILKDEAGKLYLLDFDFNHRYMVHEIERVQVKNGDTTFVLK